MAQAVAPDNTLGVAIRVHPVPARTPFLQEPINRATDNMQELDEFEREEPIWYSAKNASLQREATQALRDTLVKAAAARTESTQFWTVFQDFILRHQYSEFMDILIADSRESIKAAILENEHEQLRKEVVAKIRSEISVELRSQITTELRPEVEAELRLTLRDTIKASVVKRLDGELLGTVKAAVERELRKELLADEKFTNDVKLELQRKILGL